MEHAETFGSLALSRRPREAARTLPRTINPSPRRPAQPAEEAQARVFERLLKTECAELQELAQRMAGDVSGPAGELTEIRSRIDEIRGLLRALQGRFPHPVPDGER